MNLKTTLLGGAAAFAVALASAPTTADALSVQFFEGGALIGSATDGDADGVLTAFATLSGGLGNIAGNFSTVQNFPLVDQLFSTFNFSGSITDVVVQVTHNFNNDLPVPVLGSGSANNNFLVGVTDVTSAVYLGTSAYDLGTLVTSATGATTATSTGTASVTDADYWVTQVVTVSSSSNGGTATTEWVAPVPLPAGILLLGTALGGLGIARRRNAKKADA